MHAPSGRRRSDSDGWASCQASVATKTNTPLINIPQSVSVVTKDFIRDQGYQSLTDVTRYIPGVAVHQGEGNRDELVIRGVDSSANFFVNGFRDDVGAWLLALPADIQSQPAVQLALVDYYIGTTNWLLLFPAFFLVSTLFALNFVGDGLRDALDPRDR